MKDELFQAYKAKASELLTAKLPFGGHQRRAFEIIVGAEIERLKGEITELTKHVQLGCFAEPLRGAARARHWRFCIRSSN
jgi:hypothetical protein